MRVESCTDCVLPRVRGRGRLCTRPTAPLNEQTQPLFDRGYAVIQSAYSTSGWALAEAYPETEQLRLYFLNRYAKPAQGKAAKTMETIVAGGVYGWGAGGGGA